MVQLKQIIAPKGIKLMQQQIIDEEKHKNNRKEADEDFRTIFRNGFHQLKEFNQMLTKKMIKQI